ncbi:MAG: pyridoxal-phosphate dependent enzyme [Pyrobaculum sp.]|nr:pyridoxal-phosphate dependent enzyme [Pyrobaculum sp.]
MCLRHYEEFIRSGFYEVDSGEVAGCFSALLDRPVEVGEVVRLEELMPKPSLHRVFNSSVELLTGGWPTPLLKVSGPPREAYAKLEWFNPFSASVKDRTTYYLLKSVGGDWLVEVSSGNVAVALAALGNVLGKRVKLYIPTAGRYVAPLLDFLGAEYQILDVSMTVEALEHLQKDIREGAVHPNQFGNDMNFVAHLRTAAELDWQLSAVGKRPDYVVAGLGTSGHASALGFYFGVRYGTKLIGVQPRDWIPGIRRVETGMKWLSLISAEVVDVSLREALEGVREFAKRTGLLIGPSAGAVYKAFAAQRRDGVYVLMFPDSLMKYTLLLEQLR